MCSWYPTKSTVKYLVPLLCGVAVVALILYLAFFYTFSPGYLPNVPSGKMDVHAITAGALQANADLLTTIALALSALFEFSVSIHFSADNLARYLGMILTTGFALSITFVFVNAYNVYHSIAVQTDHDVFFLDRIEPLINDQTMWVMVCAGLSVVAFCWRCVKIIRSGVSNAD
jgi:hypothetical protein